MSCLSAPPALMRVSVVWLSQLHPRQEEWPEEEGGTLLPRWIPWHSSTGQLLPSHWTLPTPNQGRLANTLPVGQFATSQPYKVLASKEQGRGGDGQTLVASATVEPSLVVT